MKRRNRAKSRLKKTNPLVLRWLIIISILTAGAWVSVFYLIQRIEGLENHVGIVRTVFNTKEKLVSTDNVDLADIYVSQAVHEFFPKSQHSEMKMIMHCLLNRESKHGVDKGHGDGGRAGGPLQFHQPTWVAYRKLMGEPESSRYNLKEAIRTTAWAISDGRGLAWGGILRASKGNNYAACQVPSFYN